MLKPLNAGFPMVGSISDPSRRQAAIATLKAGRTGTDPTDYTYTTDGTLDTLFSDTVDIPYYTDYVAFYVGVAGNIKYNDADGNPIGPIAVPQGILPFCPRRIFSTGTTITQVVGARL